MIDIRKIEKNEDFENFISENKKVCIKFSADWCQPCKTLGQRLKNIDSEKIGNTLFAEIDISENEECEAIAEKYGVTNIPCMMYFKNGEMVDRSVGLVPLDDIYNRINKLSE